MTLVDTGPLLAADLQNEFADTYASTLRDSAAWLEKVMDMNLTGTTRQIRYGYPKAAPHMEYWPYHTAIPRGAMGARQWTVHVFNYAKQIAWNKFDREDDVLQSLPGQANQLGESAGLIPERGFIECLLGSASLLPAVPTAPDGQAAAATTDGSGTRFGLADGNKVSGSGVDTVSNVWTDYYEVIEQFLEMQDGQGQYLHPPERVKQGLFILASVADMQIMHQAFQQMRPGIVYGSNTAAAAVTNLIQDSNFVPEIDFTPRISTGDWYVFLKGSPRKPFFMVERKPLFSISSFESSGNTNVRLMNSAEEAVQWEWRLAFGIAEPYGLVMVNN